MLATLLVGVIGYIWLVHWLVFGRGAFAVVYNPVIGWCVRRIGMAACTIGARCYMATATTRMTITGYRHEEAHYVHQWCVRPYTFVPRYLYWLARVGYDQHPDEQEARLIAGEPLR